MAAAKTSASPVFTILVAIATLVAMGAIVVAPRLASCWTEGAACLAGIRAPTDPNKTLTANLAEPPSATSSALDLQPADHLAVSTTAPSAEALSVPVPAPASGTAGVDVSVIAPSASVADTPVSAPPSIAAALVPATPSTPAPVDLAAPSVALSMAAAPSEAVPAPATELAPASLPPAAPSAPPMASSVEPSSAPVPEEASAIPASPAPPMVTTRSIGVIEAGKGGPSVISMPVVKATPLSPDLIAGEPGGAQVTSLPPATGNGQSITALP